MPLSSLFLEKRLAESIDGLAASLPSPKETRRQKGGSVTFLFANAAHAEKVREFLSSQALVQHLKPWFTMRRAGKAAWVGMEPKSLKGRAVANRLAAALEKSRSPES